MTDNASAMSGAWGKLQKKFPHLIAYGCLAHGVNLAIGDILKRETTKTILNDAGDIIHFFRRKIKPKEILNNMMIQLKQKPAAVVDAVATRWGLHKAALHSLLRAQNALLLAANHPKLQGIMTDEIKDNIIDRTFWETIQNLYDLLARPSELIRVLEGDTPTLSCFTLKIKKLFKFFKKSLFFFSTQEEEALKIKLDERRMFLHHPVQLAAHLLNPKLKLKGLSETEIRMASEFICGRASLIPDMDAGQVHSDLRKFIHLFLNFITLNFLFV